VMPNASLTHRRPDLFPEPERFRPERFLERAYGPHEFAPFGGGIRRCLGEQLALRQMGIVAVELLRAFEIEPAGPWGSAEQRRHTMILPRDSLRARIRRRGAPAPRIET
jgi:cytochrome P450